ncbi:hypothetical protein [Spirillospora sp. CA-128828]|uniref:hypothetical protein n=1 Tax=Spirillospora sp. CA-128828 TaxID=3240033 RepID=UPI003D928B25
MFSATEIGVVVAITLIALIVGGCLDGLRCAIGSGLGGLSCGFAGAYFFGVAGAATGGVIGAALGIVVVVFVIDDDGDGGGDGGIDITALF